MLSMKGNFAAGAKGYLAKENYYQKNSEMGQFHGKALKHFGLEEGQEVTTELYHKMVDGIHPVTDEKLQKNSGKYDRRAIVDLTFSAPKSISVLMEAMESMGDEKGGIELRQWHRDAIKKTMDIVQERFAKTRVYDNNGNRVVAKTEIAFASFQHDTARMVEGELDPQLHDHNPIFTTTIYTDPMIGEVKHLSLKNDELFNNKMYLGQTYRSEFAKLLKEAGYEIEVTDPTKGLFDIKGFSQEQLDEFSGRSRSIRAFLPEYREKFPHMNEAQLLEIIGQEKKSAKNEIDRDVLRERNGERLREVGVDELFLYDMKIKKEANKEAYAEMSLEIKENLIKEHLDKAAKALTDYQSVFSSEKLMDISLKYGMEHQFTEDDYREVLIKNTDIIKLENNVYSTQRMIDAELNIIDAVNNGKNTQKGYQEDIVEIDKFIDKKYSIMTKGQREMCRDILTSKDQVHVIQGDAGTGKTFAAEAINEFIQFHHSNVMIEGVAPTGRASAGLEEDSGIKSQTLHKYLYKSGREETSENTPKLIMVDEAGMVGSVQVSDIINTLNPNDKIVFMGDTKQFKSISAGRAFADMQKYGVATTYLDEVMRQEDGYTKDAVTLLKEQAVKLSLDKIEEGGKYIEAGRDEQISQIVDEFVALPKTKQQKIGIVTSTNQDRTDINDKIREKLGLEGDLYTVRQNISLTGVKAHFNTDYKEGMFIAMEGTNHPFGRGAQLVITGKSSSDNKTIAVKPVKGGQEAELNVYEYGNSIQLYQEVQKSFQEGDCITFTKNTTVDKKKRMEVKNGDRTHIKSIDKDGIVTTESGKKFNINNMNYVDHGYAATDVKFQGATVEKVIIMVRSAMASFNAFYTQITRAKKEISVFTDDKEQLESRVLKAQEDESTLNYLLDKNGTKKERIPDGTNTRETRTNGKEPERRNEVNSPKAERSRKIPVADTREDRSSRENTGSYTQAAKGASERTRRRERGKSAHRVVRAASAVDGSIVSKIRQLKVKIEEAIKKVDQVITKRIDNIKSKAGVVAKKALVKKQTVKQFTEQPVKKPEPKIQSVLKDEKVHQPEPKGRGLER